MIEDPTWNFKPCNIEKEFASAIDVFVEYYGWKAVFNILKLVCERRRDVIMGGILEGIESFVEEHL